MKCTYTYLILILTGFLIAACISKKPPNTNKPPFTSANNSASPQQKNIITSMDIASIKQLGRAKIIQLAIELIELPIHPADYHIKVFTNQSRVFVSFRQPIKFIPFNSVHYYGAFVDIGKKLVNYATYANPENYTMEGQTMSFYQANKTDNKHLKFVLNAINRQSKSTVQIAQATFTDELVIKEQATHYQILELYEHYELWYKIDNKTGKKYDEVTATIAPAPIDKEEDNDPLIELKE